ncbi:MAG: hypothetical protein KJ760_19260, partial [Proteobacteria bacterium]|nr:hypothetical protein [Pseudomonadota bacterium]
MVSASNLTPVAGEKISITVEAVDTNGERARSFNGEVWFTVDSGLPDGSGPEYRRSPNTKLDSEYADEQGWLPSVYQFTVGFGKDEGRKVFTVSVSSESTKLVKSGVRTIRVTDIPGDGLGVDNITGSTQVVVSPATPEKLRAVMPNQSRAPGIVNGLTGAIAPQTAGVSVRTQTGNDVWVDICDKYWNVVPSTSTKVRLTTSDPYDTPSEQVKTLTSGAGLPQGTTSFDITFIKRSGPPGSGHYLVAVDSTGWLATAWDGSAKSQYIPVVANTAQKLQLLIPGETATEGKPPWDLPSGGKTWTLISTQTAGVSFAVTVNACDNYWNLNSGANQWIKIETSDKYDVHPTSQPLVGGATTFAVTLVTGNLTGGNTSYAINYVSATVVSGGSLNPASSQPVPVKPNTITAAGMKLIVLMPGESHEPGWTAGAGKLGSPQQLTAGTTFTATVYLVDSYYNITSTVPTGSMPIVSVWTDEPRDPFAPLIEGEGTQLVAGRRTFDLYMLMANDSLLSGKDPDMQPNWKVSAKDNDGIDPYYGQVNSSNLTVNPNPAKRLLLLVPDEGQRPGTATGKVTEPSVVIKSTVAGQGYVVIVRAVDEYWNRATAETRAVRIISPDDLYDTEPQGSLVDGSRSFTVTLKTVGLTGSKTHRIWAVDNSGIIPALSTGTIGTAGNEKTMTLLTAPAIKLSLIVQGEAEEPGSPSGKS